MNKHPKATMTQKERSPAEEWLYHYTSIGVAGLGMFSDAYDLFSISLVTDLLGRIYYPHNGGVLPVGVYAAVVGVAFCGSILGQLVFGWLGDKLGRVPVYGITLKLMVIFSVASGFSFRDQTVNVVATLCFFRFWLGFSIGGDYPLSATIMCEFADRRSRGAFMAAIFAMQGVGNLSSSVVAMILSAAFKHSRAYQHDPLGQADYVWRIILMVGAIPALLTYYWRRKIPETARYTALVAMNANAGTSDRGRGRGRHTIVDVGEEFSLFSRHFVDVHGAQLAGTAVCWMVLDVSFFSLTLFSKDIFSHIGWFGDTTTMSPLEQTYRVARTQALLALCGHLPGYLVAIFLVDRIGRIKIQMTGFLMMNIFMLGLAVPYKHWGQAHGHLSFVAIYACIFFFANLGPNTTTFIVPAEIFPTRMRATCHGISGAAGKVGAIIGVFGFLYFRWHIFSSMVMLILCNVVGFVVSWFLPEPKGRSLEESSGDIELVELRQDPSPTGHTNRIYTV